MNNNQNIINTLLQTTLQDILKFCLPFLGFCYIVRVEYLINNQISNLQKEVKDLLIKIDSFKEEILILQKNNLEKESVIRRLSEQISQLNEELTLKAGSVTTNIDQITANNDMIKFYIQCAGATIGIVLITYVLSSWFPQVFAAKTLLPTPLYRAVQDWTPFFQEKASYTRKDNQCELDWLVDVINEKNRLYKSKTFLS